MFSIHGSSTRARFLPIISLLALAIPASRAHADYLVNWTSPAEGQPILGDRSYYFVRRIAA